MKNLKHISICAAIVLTISFLVGAFSWKFFNKDNPLEQIAEKIIEEQTGLDIDFTPEK